MDEIRLHPVTYTELSSLRHEVAISEGPRFQTPEFLVVRYSGSYRYGAEGKGDALYIVSTATAARKAWWSPSTILDFRDLEYHWGDEMEWISSIVWDPGIRAYEPFAVVVGDNCRQSLRSLLREDYQNFCVETLEVAFAQCRRKAQEHKQLLKEIRDRV
jgi:hypothetical protein